MAVGGNSDGGGGNTTINYNGRAVAVAGAVAVAVARAVVEAVGRGQWAVFNNQLKVAAKVMMTATTVTGSSYGCDNGNDGVGDDGGCGDRDGETNRGSGGDSNTVGGSGGDGNSNSGSVGDSESDGGDGDSDSVSRGDGNCDGSSESENNSIAVSLIPILVDCCISPTAITVAANCHRDRDRPCHRPHPRHHTTLALALATAPRRC